MQKIPLNREQIKQLEIQNKKHFQSNLKQLFAMIPKDKNNGKK